MGMNTNVEEEEEEGNKLESSIAQCLNVPNGNNRTNIVSQKTFGQNIFLSAVNSEIATTFIQGNSTHFGQRIEAKKHILHESAGNVLGIQRAKPNSRALDTIQGLPAIR